MIKLEIGEGDISSHLFYSLFIDNILWLSPYESWLFMSYFYLVEYILIHGHSKPHLFSKYFSLSYNEIIFVIHIHEKNLEDKYLLICLTSSIKILWDLMSRFRSELCLSCLT